MADMAGAMSQRYCGTSNAASRSSDIVGSFLRLHTGSSPRRGDSRKVIESIFLEDPGARRRYRTAPLLKEREQFLSHLLRRGTSRYRVRSVAAYLIHIIRLMELTSLRNVELGEIKKAGECWANYRGPHRRRRAGKAAAFCFTNVAKNWLHFHGR
jgi:integrase/recombinase XerD